MNSIEDMVETCRGPIKNRLRTSRVIKDAIMNLCRKIKNKTNATVLWENIFCCKPIYELSSTKTTKIVMIAMIECKTICTRNFGAIVSATSAHRPAAFRTRAFLGHREVKVGIRNEKIFEPKYG